MATPPKAPAHDSQTFYHFLEQALTIGAKRVSSRRLPEFIGALTYIGYAALIASAVMLKASSVAVVAGVSLLGTVAAVVLILLLQGRLASVILNTLAVLVVVTLLGNVAFATIRLLPTPPKPVPTVKIWGIVRDNRGVGVQGAIVKVAGHEQQTTSINSWGEFYFYEVPQQWILDGSIFLLVEYKNHQQQANVKIDRLPIDIRITSPAPTFSEREPDAVKPTTKPLPLATNAAPASGSEREPDAVKPTTKPLPLTTKVAPASNEELATVYNDRGNEAWNHGDMQAAASFYKEARSRQPNNALYNINVGTALNRLRKFDEAVQYLDEGVQLDPTFAWYHNELCVALTLNGAPQPNNEHCRIAIAKDPRNKEFQASLIHSLRSSK
jgi:hypothetical protein